MPADLRDLDRRLSRHLETRRAILLSADEVRLLNSVGVGAMLKEALEFHQNPRDFPDVEIDRCPDCGQVGEAGVYFIQLGADGPIKIGYSVTPQKRLWGLQTSHPETLNLLATIPGPQSNEAALHRFYEREHLRGEWFRPSLRLRAYVEELAR